MERWWNSYICKRSRTLVSQVTLLTNIILFSRLILVQGVGKNSRVCSDNLDYQKETILKAWEKTKLTANFDFEKELENPDIEEEFILQIEMEKLMIDEFENDAESSEDEVSGICTVPAVKEKKVKQSKITDFFGTDK